MPSFWKSFAYLVHTETPTHRFNIYTLWKPFCRGQKRCFSVEGLNRFNQLHVDVLWVTGSNFGLWPFIYKPCQLVNPHIRMGYQQFNQRVSLLHFINFQRLEEFKQYSISHMKNLTKIWEKSETFFLHISSAYPVSVTKRVEVNLQLENRTEGNTAQ